MRARLSVRLTRKCCGPASVLNHAATDLMALRSPSRFLGDLRHSTGFATGELTDAGAPGSATTAGAGHAAAARAGLGHHALIQLVQRVSKQHVKPELDESKHDYL